MRELLPLSAAKRPPGCSEAQPTLLIGLRTVGENISAPEGSAPPAPRLRLNPTTLLSWPEQLRGRSTRRRDGTFTCVSLNMSTHSGGDTAHLGATVSGTAA